MVQDWLRRSIPFIPCNLVLALLIFAVSRLHDILFANRTASIPRTPPTIEHSHLIYHCLRSTWCQTYKLRLISLSFRPYDLYHIFPVSTEFQISDFQLYITETNRLCTYTQLPRYSNNITTRSLYLTNAQLCPLLPPKKSSLTYLSTF